MHLNFGEKKNSRFDPGHCPYDVDLGNPNLCGKSLRTENRRGARLSSNNLPDLQSE